MDKVIVKEIFLLTFEIFKALCEIVWKKIKGLIVLMWDRFFGLADVSRTGYLSGVGRYGRRRMAERS